jgi:hypothetical protein
MALKSVLALFNYMVAHKGKMVSVEQVDKASKKPGYSSKHISMLRRRGCIIDSVRGDTEKMENGREVLGYILRKHLDELPAKPSNIRHLGEKQKRPRKDSSDRVARSREKEPKRRVSVARSVRGSPAAPEQAAATNGHVPPETLSGGDISPQEMANLCDVNDDFSNVEGLTDIDSLIDAENQHPHT